MIGLGLEFTQPELNQISSNPSLFMSAPTSFLTELLSQWVQWLTVDHPTKPTLRALCETLRSSLVGLGSLAEKVEREMKFGKVDKETRNKINTRAVTISEINHILPSTIRAIISSLTCTCTSMASNSTSDSKCYLAVQVQVRVLLLP